MRAKIVRVEQTNNGAIGALLLDNSILCWTLEPDIDELGKLYIQPGLYQCQRFHGAKWPNTFEIIVSGHTAVLFHVGNTETDSQGCVLLGHRLGAIAGRRAVLESRQAFEDFLNKTEGLQSFPLVIVDQY